MSRPRFLLALSAAFMLAGTWSSVHVRSQRRGDTPQRLLVERYCGGIARAAMAARRRCACEAETSDSLSELSAQCEFWLLKDSPLRRAQTLVVRQRALSRCLADVEMRLATCTRVRVPESCQLDRIFTQPTFAQPSDAAGPSVVLGLPEGADCRRANGDEGFNAHYVCADGLVCDGTCQRPISPRCEADNACAGGERCVGGACRASVCAGALELPCACG